ncbi:MAG: MBL fold metallo-hydrolase [Myxococcota bacterium]|jgi:L-ascorbate metabolism protein UlaG (beta-lactamase superfamily)
MRKNPQSISIIIAAIACLLAGAQARGGEKGMTPQELVKGFTWLGHDTFVIRAGGKVIVTDPFQMTTGVKADLILITHDHFDHCSPEDVAKVSGPGTRIVASEAAAKKLGGKVTALKPGGTVTVSGVAIEAVPAYNTNKKFHPKSAGMLGYIFTVEGVRVYLAGDTDLIPEMKAVKADIAMLPVGGTYTMTAAEAADAALLMKPAVAVPMHYGSVVGTDGDAMTFKKLLGGKVDVVIIPKAR